MALTKASHGYTAFGYYYNTTYGLYVWAGTHSDTLAEKLRELVAEISELNTGTNDWVLVTFEEGVEYIDPPCSSMDIRENIQVCLVEKKNPDFRKISIEDYIKSLTEVKEEDPSVKKPSVCFEIHVDKKQFEKVDYMKFVRESCGSSGTRYKPAV